MVQLLLGLISMFSIKEPTALPASLLLRLMKKRGIATAHPHFLLGPLPPHNHHNGDLSI